MINRSSTIVNLHNKTIIVNKYKSHLLIFLTIFPIIKPSLPALQVILGYRMGSGISSILSAWNLLAFLFLCVYYVLSRTKPTILFVSVILLYGSLCVNDLLNDDFSIQNIGPIICNILIIFGLADIYKKKINIYIYIWYIVITFLMILNSITMYIYYPNGIYIGGLQENNSNYYLFALDNVSFLYSMAGLFLGDILCQTRSISCKLHYIIYIFILFAYVYVQAGTAIAILVIYTIFRLLQITRIRKIFIYPICLVFMFMSFLFIVILNSVGIFRPLLNLIHKDLTFSGRTYIWSSAIAGLQNGHLLFGFGTDSTVIPHVLSTYGPRWLIGIAHLHNICMQFLFTGGLISLLFFVLVLLVPLFYTSKLQNYKLYNLIVCQLVLTWLAFMFEFRFETYTFWLIPIILFNINYIEVKK